MSIKFKKLNDGSWGLLALGETLEPGETVKVRTKAGGPKDVVVGRIIHEGNGATIATLVESARTCVHDAQCTFCGAAHAASLCPLLALLTRTEQKDEP